jgi:4-hydroxy-3-methylbut-2-enyl diphosphate reductase
MKKTLFFANPFGFCAGVENAINSFDDLINLKDDNETVYGYHDIVHNIYIKQYFEKKNVIFKDNIFDIPDNSYVVFSAHGVGLNIIQAANQKKLKIIDLTCPLVSKVHNQIQKFIDKGCQKIIYIGDKVHQESKGTLDRIEKLGLKFDVIYNIEDIDRLDLNNLQNLQLGYLSQTTLNAKNVSEIIKKLKQIFPNILGGELGDLCHATKNRQGAVENIFLASEKNNILIDCLIVIGSNTSSNSKKLTEIGLQFNTESYLVDNLDDMIKKISLVKIQNLKNIILTAGASAPKILIDQILKYFEDSLNFEIKIQKFIEENIVFHPPKIIRDLRKKNHINNLNS